MDYEKLPVARLAEHLRKYDVMAQMFADRCQDASAKALLDAPEVWPEYDFATVLPRLPKKLAPGESAETEGVIPTDKTVLIRTVRATGLRVDVYDRTGLKHESSGYEGCSGIWLAVPPRQKLKIRVRTQAPSLTATSCSRCGAT